MKYDAKFRLIAILLGCISLLFLFLELWFLLFFSIIYQLYHIFRYPWGHKND